jgi:hypothetical protein
MSTIAERQSILQQAPFTLSLAQELLASYGSPLYVYQSDILRRTIARITKAISYPRTQFCFASVTNGSVALLQIFRDLRVGTARQYTGRYLFRNSGRFCTQKHCLQRQQLAPK